MRVDHSHLDLGELGFIDSYELSGENGELIYEFPPEETDVETVAFAVVLGTQERSLDFGYNKERIPKEDHIIKPKKPNEFGMISRIDEPKTGLRAVFEFSGGDVPIMVHFAVFRKIKKSFSKLLDSAINKFKDKCWVCRKLVKFLISLILDWGMEDAAETGLEIILKKLPEEMSEDISGSSLDTMYKEIVQHLEEFLKQAKRWHPGHRIAEDVCLKLNYCTAVE